MSYQSNTATLWIKIFSLDDHSAGAYKMVHDSDGNLTNQVGAYDDVQDLFRIFDTVWCEKLTSEDYRQAHNLEQLDLDSKIVLGNWNNVDLPMLSPRAVGLITLYRFVEYNPKLTPQDNLINSKSFALAQLNTILSDIIIPLRNNPNLISKFPELSFEWFDDEFIALFTAVFDVLIVNGPIPAKFGTDFSDNSSVEFNTMAWVLDIHHSINGQDPSTHSAWEVGLRSEQPKMLLSEYSQHRKAEWAKIKAYKFFIPLMKKDYGNYIQSNFDDFDFEMNEPYEEDLEELVGKLPKD